MGTVRHDALLREIDEMVAGQHIKDHPLVAAICDGEVSHDALRGFATQFYFVGPKPNPRPQCLVYALAPENDPDIEHLWFDDVLMEEATGNQSGTGHHLTIYFNWCAELGLTPDDMRRVEPIPETLAFEQWRYHNGFKGDWLSAIWGISFIEAASAERNDLLIGGFVKHYNFERGSQGLQYWELHSSEIEEGHGDIGRVMVERYANDEFTQQRARLAVRRSIDLQWSAFDGMYRAFVEEHPRYERWRKEL